MLYHTLICFFNNNQQCQYGFYIVIFGCRKGRFNEICKFAAKLEKRVLKSIQKMYQNLYDLSHSINF